MPLNSDCAGVPWPTVTGRFKCTGGNIFIAAIHEGNVSLHSGGGSVIIPKVKGVDVEVSSSGGSVVGWVSGNRVSVGSGGGAISLKGLVSTSGEVDSDGGPVTLGACYGDMLRIKSGLGGTCGYCYK